jgi:hypothetical protein
MSVPAESLDVRLARLEGAYEQINERLSERRGDLQTLQTLIRGLGDTFRSEITAGDTALRSEMTEIRRQASAQFCWTLTLLLGSILMPFLRDLTR